MKAILIIFMSMIAVLSGCTKENKNIEQGSNKELTIKNGDRVLSFQKEPQRLVTLRQHITETALELELDKYIVGSSDIIDPPVAVHLQKRYSQLPIIAEKYPSPEILLAAEPDIIWVDRKWAFVKNQLGSMQNIEKHGIKVYLSEGGYHNGSKLEYVYDDLRNMGKIFGKSKRAEVLCNQMQEKVKSIEKKIGSTSQKPKALDFDSARNNLAFVGCRCMADDLIRLAGGENIFNDIDKEWASVNWEEVVKRNPDVIIVHEFRGVSGASKITQLKANPLLQEVNAVKNNRFIIINLDEVYEGVRNAEAVEKFAQGFYPEKFY